MKISVLVPDLSHNCLGRAYLLAKMLEKQYEVEIVGPLFGKKIWEPVAFDKTVTYKSVKIFGKIRPYWQLKKLLEKIRGDVIYVSKPLLTSFGLGILKKLVNKKPLVLDIDDWEMGMARKDFKLLIRSAFFLWGLDSYWNRLIFEKMVGLADEITVSNTFLQKKFGGTIIWNGRDPEIFDPGKFEKDLMRKKYRIPKDKKVVMFLGSIGVYKGVEDLIEAVRLIEQANLVVVGIDKANDYSLKILKLGRKNLGERFVSFGLQPFKKVPEFLVMADVIAIPQRKTPATIGQMPARVFDAMVMKKTIVATRVSDLPLVLRGYGLVVEPGNYRKLARALRYLLTHPKEAEKMGEKARKRFIKNYSFEVMRKRLFKIFSRYEA